MIKISTIKNTAMRFAAYEKTPRFRIVADTHAGLVRTKNEDSYCYCNSPEHANVLAVVADGIGGHESGEVASRMCCEKFIANWKTGNCADEKNELAVSDFLERTIKEANFEIRDMNFGHDVDLPMGTTVIAAVMMKSKMVVAHAGDSRLYRLRHHKLDQLTRDHTLVEELFRRHVITAEEAECHPYSHLISRSVGVEAEIKVEMNIFERRTQDLYLLCSDGLTGHVDNIQIKHCMNSSHDPARIVRHLLKAALIGGGEDNITIVCVR